jgi:hypothetical protein
MLITGALDGLSCVFDVQVRGEEDALAGAMNVGSSINRIGFAGRDAEQMYVLTSTETLSLWDWDAATLVAGFEAPREEIAQECGTEVDYLIGGHYDAAADEFTVLAGAQNGSLFLVAVRPEEGLCVVGGFSDPKRGHHAGVRCFDWQCIGDVGAGAGGGAGGGGSYVSLVTGGEDGRLCHWTTAPAPASATSASAEVQAAWGGESGGGGGGGGGGGDGGGGGGGGRGGGSRFEF